MSAMPAEKLTTECPACGRHSLVKHCDTRSCTWATCRNKDCDLVYDVRTGRGHKFSDDRAIPGGLRPRVRWTWKAKS